MSPLAHPSRLHCCGDRKITQVQLAHLCGFHKNYNSNLEQGQVNITWDAHLGGLAEGDRRPKGRPLMCSTVLLLVSSGDTIGMCI
jgi:hypothetical protein